MPVEVRNILITLAKTFIGAALGQLIVFGTGVLDMTAGEWKGVLAAGIAAVVVASYNFVNPAYEGYGLTRHTDVTEGE